MAIERMLSEELPARVLVARVLAEAGIEYVFGISGGHTGRIISGLSQVQEPIAAVQATQLAIKHAMAGQPGPVAVLFSHDALAGSVAPDSQPVLYPTRFYLPPPPPPADPGEIAAAAERILAAERPVIIAGNGLRIP